MDISKNFKNADTILKGDLAYAFRRDDKMKFPLKGEAFIAKLDNLANYCKGQAIACKAEMKKHHKELSEMGFEPKSKNGVGVYWGWDSNWSQETKTKIDAYDSCRRKCQSNIAEMLFAQNLAKVVDGKKTYQLNAAQMMSLTPVEQKFDGLTDADIGI